MMLLKVAMRRNQIDMMISLMVQQVAKKLKDKRQKRTMEEIFKKVPTKYFESEYYFAVGVMT